MSRGATLCIAILAVAACTEDTYGNRPPDQNWRSNAPSDVTWECNTYNGTGLFSIRYNPHPGHHRHPVEQKPLPLTMMRDLIACGQDDMQEALTEAVLVTWARVGHLRRSRQCNQQPQGHESQDAHERKLAETFIKAHMQHANITNVSEIFTPSNLYHFSRSLFQAGFKSEHCCGVKGHTCTGHVTDRRGLAFRNFTVVYDKLRRSYDRETPLLVTTSVLKYLNLAHSNHLLCVDINTFNNTKNKADKMAHIIQYILLGYNFIATDDACPINYVQNIYKQHAGSGDMQLSERELNTLMQKLNLTRADSAAHTTPTTHTASNHTTATTTQPGHSGRSERSHDAYRPPPRGPVEQSYKHALYDLYSGPAIGAHPKDKCLSPREMMHVFHKEHGHNSVDLTGFTDLCPILLQQVLTNTCRDPLAYVPTETPRSVNASEVPEVAEKANSREYLFGSLSILVISSCSLLGVVFVKFTQSAVKHYMMGSMLALAVGCLVADAVLHLLPEISAIHPTEEREGDMELLPDNLQKLCALLASIYAFFMLELYLSGHASHSHSHGPDIPKETTIVVKNNDLKGTNSHRDDAIKLQQWKKLEKTINTDGASSSIDVMQIPRGEDTSASTRTNSVSDTSDTGTAKAEKHKGIKALAWMIIIGDGIHNFADGLAVGAAFSLSFTKGMSTSITVLCHELPHELGDFAVLLSTGMSVKRAVLLNFLSSLTAFAGLYLGLGLGDQPEACRWIFAVGAGMFMYVALTDLTRFHLDAELASAMFQKFLDKRQEAAVYIIPECKEFYRRTPDWKMALGQNIGILVGYTGMLLLAMFEDRMEI